MTETKSVQKKIPFYVRIVFVLILLSICYFYFYFTHFDRHDFNELQSSLDKTSAFLPVQEYKLYNKIKAFKPEDFTCSALSSSDSSKKLVSVLVAEYKGANRIQSVLDAIWDQTYRPIEIIISVDESPDADESERIVKQFQKDHLEGDVELYRQKDRLHWVDNVNFLFSKSKGDYVAFMPHDDWIPPNYIEKLAQCLDNDPQATNCYPIMNTNLEPGLQLKIEPKIYQKSIIGPQYERVDQALTDSCAVSFRGLVRRPSHGSMQPFYLPRLYKNFHLADIVQLLYHATAGHMKQVEVQYNKTFREDSVHSTRMQVRSDKAYLHLFTELYNSGHSYASSSRNAYSKIREKIKNDTTAETFDNKINRQKRVAILGGGIQGCLMALMLKKHGYDVTIYDKSNDIMNRASVGGEGKVHLGLVYNKDLSMKTGKYMMRSALRFSSYIDYLVGKEINWDALKSERFNYLLPYSSLITPREFEDYASKLEEIYEDMLMENPQLSYLGLRPPKLVERQITLNPILNETFFEAQYISAEYSVSPKNLKAVIKEALVTQSIKMVFNRRVTSVSRNGPGNDSLGNLRVVTDVSDHDFDMVVNCLWEQRAIIDKTIGMKFESGGNYRYKIGIKFPFMDQFAKLPSLTIVNGPFGDFVRYARDTGMYFSYYPVSRIGITTNQTKMLEWDDIAEGKIPDKLAKYQIEQHQKAFRNFFPKFKDPFKCPTVVGGYILGNGKEDITDKETKLHERADFPYVLDDGYISVSTQKFTSAPNNVYLLEKELFGV